MEQDASILLLSRLYVHLTSQRRGIGEDLVAATVSRHPKAKRVQLVVEATNTKALAFYGRQGFSIIGEIEEESTRLLRMEMDIEHERCRCSNH